MVAEKICAEILAKGSCHLEGCQAWHDVLICQTCMIVFTDGPTLQLHYNDPRHLQRVRKTERRTAGLSQPVQCTVCNISLSSATVYAQHSRGRRHTQCLVEQGLVADPGPEELEPNTRPGLEHCQTCDAYIIPSRWDYHLSSRRHLDAQGYVALKGALEQSELDKNGIIVADGEGVIDFGVIENKISAKSASSSAILLSLKNTNPTTINLRDARISSIRSTAGAHHCFSIEQLQGVKRISAGSSATVTVRFLAEAQQGRYQDRIELIFEDPLLHQRFAITRPLKAIVGVKEDHELLKAVSPYVRPKHRPEEPMINIVPGIAPPALAAITWKVNLPIYPLPKDLLSIAYGPGTMKDILWRIRTSHMPPLFDSNTYGRTFHNLLWIEEERARRDLQLYNMEGATLTRNRLLYQLEVNGLAEKRPSIIVTDKIHVQNYNSPGDRWFEGHVHHVNENSVDLRFSDRFISFKGQKYNVRFDLHRLVYRRMHQALDTAMNAKRILFPDPDNIGGLKRPMQSQKERLRLVDRKIAENPPQLDAVAAIVNRPEGSVPFVIFGPPGTGKTVTMVEAIRQVLLAQPNAHILACAPSNSAADLIAERLASLGKTKVFRLIAPSRSKKLVPANVVNLSLVNSDDVFCTPSVTDLQKFSIVISTCMSASVPYGIGVPRGHFSHIFIDEAGQACEPEVMIGIKTMADNRTNIVLAGDSKQLGPIVRSPVARELGLGLSYLDRMMNRAIYDEDSGNGITLVKLTKNWRSHPAIIKFPNDEFYRSELQACADPVVIDSLLRWNGLKKAGFPVIFHGISGKDEREASSPSFFNIDEASLVKAYVKDLFDDKKLRLRADHIGIISPYNAQVCKIRTVLSTLREAPNARAIKVGSVEEFQGQERRVIIISTVRSSTDFINFDLRHTLGFVANPRRFNVSITRAEALLIVIGDPKVLSLDPLWKAFINYVHIGGGCKGAPIDWNPRAEIDRLASAADERRRQTMQERELMMERLKADIMAQSEDLTDHVDNDADALEGNTDRPWRENE